MVFAAALRPCAHMSNNDEGLLTHSCFARSTRGCRHQAIELRVLTQRSMFTSCRRC